MKLERQQIEGWKMNNGAMSPNEFIVLCDLALSSLSATAGRDAIIEECAKLCDDPRVLVTCSVEQAQDVADQLARQIRALKNAAPQAAAVTPQGQPDDLIPAVAAPNAVQATETLGAASPRQALAAGDGHGVGSCTAPTDKPRDECRGEWIDHNTFHCECGSGRMAYCLFHGVPGATYRPPSATQGSDYKALYHELLFSVGQKWPDETRHQTALRYIQQAERGSNDSVASASTGAEK